MEAVNTPRDGAFASWQFSAATGLAEAADRSRSAELRAKVGRLSAILGAARRVVEDDRAPDDRKIEAVRLLGRSEGNGAILGTLLKPQVSDKVQDAALKALEKIGDRRAGDVLVGGWNGYPPRLRSGVLDALLGRPSWTATLLSSLEDRCVPGRRDPPDLSPEAPRPAGS